MKKKMFAFTILFGILFYLSSANVLAAGEFLGDLCWSVDDGSDDTITCKLGVSSPGGGHFILFGTVQHSTDGTYTAHGNAEIITGKIHMSVIFADGNNNAMGSTHVLGVLDPSTLDGTYNGVSTGASHTGETEIKYLSGTLELISCQ